MSETYLYLKRPNIAVALVLYAMLSSFVSLCAKVVALMLCDSQAATLAVFATTKL